MGNKDKLIIDLDRCWGCKACEVACKQELVLDVGPRPMQVEEIGPRKIGDRLHQDFVPIMCQHCHQPACLEVCPNEAIYRAEDNSIQIDAELCDHCGVCEPACPYGAVEVTEQYGPVKCTFCLNRRENDWLPSCAQHCEGRAFRLVSHQEASAAISGKKYSWSAGQVVYVSDKWASLGKAAELK